MNISKQFIQCGIIITTFFMFIVLTKGKLKMCGIGLSLLSIALSATYFFLTSFYNGEISFFIRYIFFVPLMILCFRTLIGTCQYHIFFALSDLIYIISLISLFCWIGISLFDLVPDGKFFATDWGGIYDEATKGVLGYGYIYFESQATLPNISNIIPFRNCGIFCEGPAYAFILSIALLSELFLRQKENKKRISIIIAALLTTFTTSSILYLLLFIILKWYISEKGSNRRRTVFLPGLFIFFVCALIILIHYKTNQGSVNIRLSAYMNAINAFLQKPLGYGYDFDPTRFNTGITDSFSDTLVRGGIVLLFYYLFPIIFYILRYLLDSLKYGNKIPIIQRNNFVLIVWGLYVYMTTILTYTFILLTFVAYAYALLNRRTKGYGEANQSEDI